jgi:hypothetical protein
MQDNTIRPNLGTPDPKAIPIPIRKCTPMTMIMGLKAAADSPS